MANILILGAGSMGTAFSFPCSDNNHSVTIIGTHLENDFIDQINTDKSKMLNTFDKLQAIVVNLKTDMLSLLSIQVDYIDADGD